MKFQKKSERSYLHFVSIKMGKCYLKSVNIAINILYFYIEIFLMAKLIANEL